MKNKKNKRHFSSEYTMFSILEYLCINSLNSPISKYHILTKVPRIKQQRQDRISDILDILEGNGFIESIKTTESTFYKSTDKGKDVYVKWVKNFLSFVRSSSQFREEEDNY